MDRLRLLWVDMTVAKGAPELLAGVESQCEVARVSSQHSLDGCLRSFRPDAIFFDFDYPDRGGLGIAATLKESNPSVPMVLVTVQHSEALAIWTFRSRFADYLVRPVSQPDTDRCLVMLEEMISERRAQSGRRMPLLSIAVPAEVPAAVTAARSLLPAVHFVQSHMADKIAAEDLAQLCSMSPFRFSREFREVFGITFREYLLRLRLKEAARLLENPQARVAQVASAVGFTDMSYFSRMFKRHFGVQPSSVQGGSGPDLPESEATIELPALPSA